MSKKSHLPRIFIFAFLFMPISVCEVKAQNIDQNTINQQDWITRQQQNKIEEERRIREQDTIRKERGRKKKEDEETAKKQTPISGKPAECFPIKTINLVKPQ